LGGEGGGVHERKEGKILRIKHFYKKKKCQKTEKSNVSNKYNLAGITRTSRNLFLGSIRKTAFRMTSVGSLAIWSFKLLSLRWPIYLQKTYNPATQDFNARMG
jgi:hypothetical protein